MVVCHEYEIYLLKGAVVEVQKLHEGIKDEFRAMLQAQEVEPQLIDDIIKSLDLYSAEMNSIELQRIEFLQMMHKEERSDVEEQHQKDEKSIINKAPPGIF